MSGDKCCYYNCGKSRRNNKDVQFHCFPADVERSNIWVINCGNIKLHLLSPKCLRKRYVCSDHFNDCMYMNLNVEKRRLIQNAIPIKYTEQPTAHFNEVHFCETHTTPNKCEQYQEEEPTSKEDDEFDTKPSVLISTEYLKVLTPKKQYYPASMNILDHKNAALSMFSSKPSRTPDTQKCNTDFTILPSSSEKYDIIPSNNLASLKLQLKNEHLESRCNKLKKLLNQKRATISFLKKKYIKLLNNKKLKSNPKKFLKFFKFQSVSSRSLVSMQINHKQRNPWTTEEKEFSISLYNKSPSIYKYMCQNKIILPGVSTVRRWLADRKAERTSTQLVQ